MVYAECLFSFWKSALLVCVRQGVFITDEPPREIPGTKFLGFPGASVVKNLPANAGDVSSVPGLGRSPGEGNGNPLQYSCLGNPLDRAAWQATVHRVANSQPCAMTVQLNNSAKFPMSFRGWKHFTSFVICHSSRERLGSMYLVSSGLHSMHLFL